MSIHGQVDCWSPAPGECGIECFCGTVLDGYYTLADAAFALDRHVAEARQDGPADHGSRVAAVVGAILAAALAVLLGGCDMLDGGRTRTCVETSAPATGPGHGGGTFGCGVNR